jgi:tetratricopeptide (TPR) repeat protein
MTDDVVKYKTFAAGLLRNPDDPDILINQFAHLFNTANRAHIRQRMALAKRAFRIDPTKYTVAFNYGTALSAIGQYLEAIQIFKWCVAHAPDEFWLTQACHHLGISFCSNGNDAEAIEWFRKALAHKEDPEIRKDLALRLLASGKLNEGLREFECRTACTEAGIKTNPQKAVGWLPEQVWKKHWRGEDLTGKTIAVYHEDGIGDFIMICRFIPLLRQFNPAKILLTGQIPDLLELVADNIAVDGIVPLEDFDCDYVTGSMSVPWRCGVEYEHVNGKPYFSAQPATFPRRGLLNVGLVWRGNPGYQRNSHRSMDFVNYCPLLEIPNVAFYSLQIGDAGKEITAAGYDGFIGDLAPFARNWRATARLIANLDVIVTVDTACAHLAGALGVPAFVLVTKACDWRWNRNSAHTVWYDSLRIIRQYKQDDWEPCVQIAKMKLEDMVDERRQVAGSDLEGQASGDARRTAQAGS